MNLNLNNKDESQEKSCSIRCKNIPSELLNKLTAKSHFCKFGYITKIHLHPKTRSCEIEYADPESAQLASLAAKEFNNKGFDIEYIADPSSQKNATKKETEYWLTVDDPEVLAELEAMKAISNSETKKLKKRLNNKLSKTTEEMSSKSKRKWQSNIPLQDKSNKTPKYVSASGNTKLSQKDSKEEQLELLKILKTPAFTIEDKFKVLEARDKLHRLKTKSQSNLSKNQVTVGTCPDMCPEKERLMREVQHQVAVYEQANNGKGMNPNLAVKQYSRSSADQEVPLPHELRPVKVLQLTMNYLMHNIMNLGDLPDVNTAEWYHFLWDRTRGIRKDITQQELCCLGSVQLVEQCARFHIHCSARLVNEEPSVFDQKINTENLTKCLQTLKYMYHDLNLKGVKCPHEAEFRAYIILLNLNDGNFLWEVQQLEPQIQKSSEIRFAMEIYSAIDKNNYVQFFKLVKNTTYLNACILLRYFVQVRLKALKTILKCYSPRAPNTSFPLQELIKILAFEDVFSVIEFLEYYGLKINEEKTQVTLDRNLFYSPEIPLASDRAINVVESKRQVSVAEIIYGGPLPQPLFYNYVPRNSFNEEGVIDSIELMNDFKVTDVEEKSNEDIIEIIKTPTKLVINETESSTVTKIFDKEDFQGDSVDSTSKPLVSEPEKKLWIPTNKSLFRSNNKVKSNFGENSGSVSSSENTLDQSIKNMEPFSFSLKVKQKTSNIQPSKFQKKIHSTSVGGFKYDLKKTSEKNSEALELHKFELQQKLKEQRILIEEKKKEAEKALEKKVIETTIAEQKNIVQAKEEEKRRKEIQIKKIAELKRQKEHERRLAEVKRKIEEERTRKEKEKKLAELKRLEIIKMKEISKTVSELVNELVGKVEENVKNEKLKEISEHIKHWKIKIFYQKWYSKVESRKRKRKLIESSPVWLSTRTPYQEAMELFNEMQELTLRNTKRYKLGKPLPLGNFVQVDVVPINFNEIGICLLKKLKNNNVLLEREIFLKITVSLPNFKELRNGLSKLEKILEEHFGWHEDKYGRTYHVKQIKMIDISLTFLFEKKQGIRMFDNDNDALFFIAKNFNTELITRIRESTVKFKRNVIVPVCIHILQEPSEHEYKQLETVLTETNHFSEYFISFGTIETKSIQENLSVLAVSTKPPPKLLLNTLKDFLTENLSSQLWNIIISYGKWNKLFKKCLTKPKVVISLFNEALERLTDIINSRDIKEFPNFSEEFHEYQISKIPEVLPADYKYFPKFCRKEEYLNIVSNKIQMLKLPEYCFQWPPSNELELENEISDYCSTIFPDDNFLFYKLMSVILEELNPVENFEKIQEVSWMNLIETIFWAKISKTDFLLKNTKFYSKSVFNQLVVVYDPDDIMRFLRDPWFYVTNPVVSTEIKKEVRKERMANYRKSKKEKLEKIVTEEYSIDLNETFNSIAQQSSTQNTGDCKNEDDINYMKYLISDLEASIVIQQKINETFEQTVQSVLLDV